MNLKTCVTPDGRFSFGIHKPIFDVKNLRKNSFLSDLGKTDQGKTVKNTVNFPTGLVNEPNADWIFEIPNPFPFRGTTYIAKRWAETTANDLRSIGLPQPPAISLSQAIKPGGKSGERCASLLQFVKDLPEPLQIALASSSTDKEDLVALAKICCEFIFDENGKTPTGMRFTASPQGIPKPVIHNRSLFEVLANNRHLPDDYKEAMVLRPGIQGSSEIVGEWQPDAHSHAYEYLRRNSYIPWGHFAANMANDAVRYDIKDLSFSDLTGLRQLYYQRTFIRIANLLALEIDSKQESLSQAQLESIRQRVQDKLGKSDSSLPFNRTLWGWNFGFDYAPSHYRLHASHQQIHQQYALIPNSLSFRNKETDDQNVSDSFSPFACGDLIEDFVERYQAQTGSSFFNAYIKALKTNQRTDGRVDRPQQLIVYDQDDVIVFVPKAQTSQWELQLMTVQPVGNIIEADAETRYAIDRAMFVAVNILAELGARMITSIEFSKKIDQGPADQRLLYSFLPKLPESPGAFSEAQLRWINGHYPEDFAAACRLKIPTIMKRIDR